MMEEEIQIVEGGEMREEKVQEKLLVAFIDICGFKQMVEDYFSKKNDTILQILQEALHKAEERTLDNLNTLNPTPIKIRFKQFSDCVSLSMSVLSESIFLFQVIYFIDLVGSYHRILMENGIFSRGGIAFDNHFETDNLIFSKGLIKAYKIESEIAIYPRIVIDLELIENIKEEMKYVDFQPLNNHIASVIIKDWDGLFFINPFNYFWYMNLLPNTDGFTQQQLDVRTKFLEKHNLAYENISKAVEENISKYKTDYKTQKKYLWLKEFLDWHNNPTTSKISFERFA